MSETTATALHDIEAERAVLGGVFLVPEQAAELAEILAPDDFAKDANGRIFAAMLSLAAQNEPIDVITVGAALAAAGDTERAGGLAYIAGLDASVPSTGNLEAYAKRVRDTSLRRRIIAQCAATITAARDATRPVEEVIASAEEEIHRVSNLGGKQVTLAPIRDAVVRTFTELEKLYERQTDVTGLATGLPEFDNMTTGLQNGDLIILGGRPSMGKAQPLSTPVLTPRGFVQMGALRVGDKVIGSNGRATTVTGVFPQGRIPTFRAWFSDGSSTECCDEHLWFTQTRNERRRGSSGSVKTLAQIRETITRQDSDSPNHAIPVVEPVEFDPAESPPEARPLHPYLLGALLGDGSFASCGSVRFSKPESDVQQRVISLLPQGDAATVRGMEVNIRRATREHHTRSETAQAIEAMGLRGTSSLEKRVPRAYLYAPPDARMALLRGLVDTDGSITGRGQVEYSTSSPQLAADVRFLVQSLGGVLTEQRRDPFYTYKGERLRGAVSYRMMIRFPPHVRPFSSAKHHARWVEPSKREHRSFVRVEPLGDQECQCIAVDAPDHLYVTSEFIVTHNTALAMGWAAHACLTTKEPVVVFSQEMSTDSLVRRLLSSEGRVDGTRLRTGKFQEADWSKLAKAADKIARAKLFVDDTAGVTIAEIRARCRRVRAKHGRIALVVVDYIGLLRASDPRASREQQVSEFSRALKQLARELACPVVALSQLNRGLENRADKRPVMSDLRESGAIEQDADLVVFAYRDVVYDPNTADPDVAELIIAKQRNGPIGTVKVKFVKDYARFENPSNGATTSWSNM